MVIFGRGVSYETLVNTGRIETLAERRESACLKFATRAAKNDKFSVRWFPLSRIEREARSTTRRKYEERRHRTDRSKNNPIQYMVRLLNDNEET